MTARVSVSAKRWRVAPARYCEVHYTVTVGKNGGQRKYRYIISIIARVYYTSTIRAWPKRNNLAYMSAFEEQN